MIVGEDRITVPRLGTYRIYYFPLIPPPDQLVEILKGKEEERLPRYQRVRVDARVEWEDPTYMMSAHAKVVMVKANGDEGEVIDKWFTCIPFRCEPVEDVSFDVTGWLNVPTPTFGVMPIKVELSSTSLADITFRYRIRVYGTWGW